MRVSVKRISPVNTDIDGGVVPVGLEQGNLSTPEIDQLSSRICGKILVVGSRNKIYYQSGRNPDFLAISRSNQFPPFVNIFARCPSFFVTHNRRVKPIELT